MYNNPEVIITYSNENTEEAHRSLPIYAINPKSRFGQAARYDKEMKDWWEATNEVNLWLHNDLKAPMDVSSTVEIVDGTAKITYQGTATSLENEKVEIYKEVVIDFRCPRIWKLRKQSEIVMSERSERKRGSVYEEN